jgi:hypothetical protein
MYGMAAEVADLSFFPNLHKPPIFNFLAASK